MNFSKTQWNLISFIAGILLTLSFAPFNYAYLTLISLVFLFLSWHYSETPKQAAFRGFLYGLGLFGFGVTWVFVSIYFYGGANIYVALFMALVFATFWALFPALTAYISVKIAFLTDKRLLFGIIPFVWIFIEYYRGFWFLNGFPWFQVAYSQLDSAYAGFVPIIGVYGTGFLILMTVSIISYMLMRQRYLITNTVIIFILLTTGYGLKYIEWTYPIGLPIKITLIQGNISQDQKWLPENFTKTLFSYQQMTANNWSSDVIIWPETAIPAYLHTVEAPFLIPLAEKARANNTDLIVSLAAKSEDGLETYNTVLTLGTQRGMYKKNHLLPFGEYLPLQPFSGWVLKTIGVTLGNFTAGGENQPLLTAGRYPFATSICYEDAFASEVLPTLPEASYLVNVTNDAWFGNSFEPYQHMQIARMRALESGRYLARSTNTGLTGFVAPNGKIIKQAPLFEPHTLTHKVTPMGGLTPYARMGDEIILAALFLLMLVLSLYAKFQLLKPQKTK
ncbi:MAG: apolipoprotein N-acyltransferase [Methylococcales bacterium]|nr:apolipoprotein N-acyltransferase [Methylococcales bacterium]MCK5924911.1 apolipoprotein N-acyltransferase [Methylococcales bacterium]